MNRRSVLRFLGFAPVAAPAAVAAASAPALPPIDYSALARDVAEHAQRVVAASDAALGKRIDGTVARFGEPEANPGLTHPFTFDGETLRGPSLVVPRGAG